MVPGFQKVQGILRHPLTNKKSAKLQPIVSLSQCRRNCRRSGLQARCFNCLPNFMFTANAFFFKVENLEASEIA